MIETCYKCKEEKEVYEVERQLICMDCRMQSVREFSQEIPTKRPNVVPVVTPFTVGTEDEVKEKLVSTCLCVTQQVEVPVLDENGNPILDGNGDPLTEFVGMVDVPKHDDAGEPIINEDGTIDSVSKLAYESQFALVKIIDKDTGKELEVLIGDTTNPNTQLIGYGYDPTHYVTVKTYVPEHVVPMATISEDGKTVTWQILNTRIESQLLYNQIKTTLFCSPLANIENLYFTIGLPEGAYPEVLENGEIAFIFIDGEGMFSPKPIAWDYLGNEIQCRYEILPEMIEDKYFLIRLIVDATPEQRVGDIRIDPTVSIDYGALIFSVRAASTSLWSMDLTGAGKSWSALAPFPKRPILVTLGGNETTDPALQILDSARSSGGVLTPWMNFLEGATSVLKYSTADPVSGYAPFALEGHLTPGGATSGYTQVQPIDIDFNEGFSGGSAGYFPGTSAQNARIYLSDIADRNSASEWTATGAPTTRIARNAGTQRILAKDSSGNTYLIFEEDTSRHTVAVRLPDGDFSDSGVAAAGYAGEVHYAQFKQSDGGYGLMSMKNGRLEYRFVQQSQWTKGGGATSWTTRFSCVDTTLVLSNLTSLREQGNILGLKNADGNLRVIKAAAAVAAYTDGTTKTFAQLLTDGYAFRIACATSAAVEFNIIDDIFKGVTWGSPGVIDGDVYYVIPVPTKGLFALDFTDPNNPIYGGHLTTSAATGIFTGFSYISGVSLLTYASGAKTVATRDIVFSMKGAGSVESKLVCLTASLDTTVLQRNFSPGISEGLWGGIQ